MIITAADISLLALFIQQQLDCFVEPTRKNKKRGEKIGFVRPKYLAAIYAGVTKYNLREIADILNTSASMLRIWNTESDFKAKKAEFRKKFKDFFTTYCRSHALDYQRMAAKALRIIHPDIQEELSEILLKYHIKELSGREHEVLGGIDALVRKMPGKLKDRIKNFGSMDESTIEKELQDFTQQLLDLKAFRDKTKEMIKAKKKKTH